MQMLIKHLLRRNCLFIALAITFSIAFLSLIKIGKQPIQVSHLDKIEHIIAYFFLTINWLYVLKNKPSYNFNKIFVVIACVFYGIIIEVLQTTLTSYREASVLDIVANSVGVLLALLIFNILFEKKQAI